MLKGHLIYNKICSHPAPFRRRSSRPRNRPLVLSRRLDPTPKNFAKAFRQMGCPPKYHWDGLFFSVSDDSDSPSEETSSSRLNAWMLHSSESCCGFCKDQKMAHTCSRSLAETTFQHLRAKEINMLIWIISQAWLEKTKMCFLIPGHCFLHTHPDSSLFFKTFLIRRSHDPLAAYWLSHLASSDEDFTAAKCCKSNRIVVGLTDGNYGPWHLRGNKGKHGHVFSFEKQFSFWKNDHMSTLLKFHYPGPGVTPGWSVTFRSRCVRCTRITAARGLVCKHCPPFNLWAPASAGRRTRAGSPMANVWHVSDIPLFL